MSTLDIVNLKTRNSLSIIHESCSNFVIRLLTVVGVDSSATEKILVV
jgi:hypothetical protein